MMTTHRGTLVLLIALAALACDDNRARSVGEGEDGAAQLGDGGPPDALPADARTLDAAPFVGSPDAAVDAWVGDVGVEHVAPDPVLMVGRGIGRRPQLLAIDPAAGTAEPWGAAIPIDAQGTLLEVMFDPTLERAVVRYGFPVPEGQQRRSNFSHAGYMSGERALPWQSLARSDEVVEMVVAPDLQRLWVGERRPDDPDACVDYRLVDLQAGRIERFDTQPCAALPRVWGFGPDYRVVKRDGRLSRIAGDAVEPIDPPAEPDPDSFVYALRPNSALVRGGDGTGWVRFDGAEPPPFPPDAYLIFDRYTFHGGDLWAIGDGDAGPLGTVDPPFADPRPALRPLFDAPAVRGQARRMWLYVVDGQWVGALVDAHFVDAVGDAPGPDFNRSVFDAWRRDPRSDKWVMARIRQWEGPGTPFVLHAGRFALWAEGCDLIRYDFATGRVARDTLDWPLFDVAVGTPGWWGGLDDGSGRRGRDARGQPLIAARDSGWGARCPDDWAGAGIECAAAASCGSAGDACVDGRCRCGEGEACGRLQACADGECVDWRSLERPSYCQRDEDCQPCWPDQPLDCCDAICEAGVEQWMADNGSVNHYHRCGGGGFTCELGCDCDVLPTVRGVRCVDNHCGHEILLRR